jgi:polyribonucleotide 5'-hydroxyl-kinase
MVRKVWIIKAENELRCEVGEFDPLYVRLLSGNAEIFGIEMAVGKEYAFVDETFAIFSWYGCTIETIGNCDIYPSDSTPMVSYVNTHIQLEARRDVAMANTDDGPRVLVVGPSDHGKSTTSRILAAYAARLDRTPLLVDLDVGQNSITIPGCISVVPLDKTSLSIEVIFLKQKFRHFNRFLAVIGMLRKLEPSNIFSRACNT